jgi:hypothetical protein
MVSSSSSDATSEPSIICVHRQRTLRDALVSYRIYVDGELHVRLTRGKSADIQIQAGRHALRAAVSWTGSPVLYVSVSKGQILHIVVHPNASIIQWWKVFSRSKYLRLSVDREVADD